MKKLILMIALAAAMLLPQMAVADMVTMNYGSYGNFNANIVNGISFDTFCLEATEYFTPTNTYNFVYNSAAVNGGVGPAGDPISVGTAWLYRQFLDGTLTGYIDRATSAAALQATIWWLEGEGANPGNSNIFQQAVLAKFTGFQSDGVTPNAMLDAPAGEYGVQVMNLTDINSGGRAQDMLAPTPEPATLLLMGFGSGVMGAGIRRLRRKFGKNKEVAI